MTPSPAGNGSYSASLVATAPGDSAPQLLAISAVGFRIAIADPQAPAILTAAALPAQVVGTSFSITLTASVSRPPASWSPAQGSLPSGLHLSADGVLSGTVFDFSPLSFAVRVSDAAGAFATGQFRLDKLTPPGIGQPSFFLSNPRLVSSTEVDVDAVILNSPTSRVAAVVFNVDLLTPLGSVLAPEPKRKGFVLGENLPFELGKTRHLFYSLTLAVLGDGPIATLRYALNPGRIVRQARFDIDEVNFTDPEASFDGYLPASAFLFSFRADPGKPQVVGLGQTPDGTPAPTIPDPFDPASLRTFVTLDGSASLPPTTSSAALSYSWTPGRGGAQLSDARVPTPTFTPAAAGVYSPGLRTSDGVIDSEARETQIVVQGENHLPVAVPRALADGGAPLDATPIRLASNSSLCLEPVGPLATPAQQTS